MPEEVEPREEVPPGVEAKPPSGFWRLATNDADWARASGDTGCARSPGDWARRVVAMRTRRGIARRRRRVIMLRAPRLLRIWGRRGTVCQ